jgi:hypothetical protein
MLPRSGAALLAAPIPFGQFHGDALWPGEKDQLPVMEDHDLVSELDAVGFQPCYLSLQIVDGEADMVEPQFGKVADSRVGVGIWVAVLQQLHLRSRTIWACSDSMPSTPI